MNLLITLTKKCDTLQYTEVNFISWTFKFEGRLIHEFQIPATYSFNLVICINLHIQLFIITFLLK